MSKCTNIQKCLPVSGQELLMVTIDNTTNAYWFFDYAEALKYLNQEVIVEYRKDILNGEIAQFIKTFTVPTVVKTVERVQNAKLFVDMEDNNASLSFSELTDNVTRSGCTVFCVSQEEKSSPKATWMEYVVRDRSMHTAIMRIFDFENQQAELAGKYIVTNLTKNQYGLTSDFAVVANEVAYENPEIQIAYDYIINLFASNSPVSSYLTHTALLDRLREKVDYELGYGLVRLACELDMLQSMRNISNDFDIDAACEAIVASYGYKVKDSALSPDVVNVIMANAIADWKDKKIVLLSLDTNSETECIERDIIKQVKVTVDTILRQRKG